MAEIWELTRDEWKDQGIRAHGITPDQSVKWDTMAMKVFTTSAHRLHVLNAIREGKAVPPEILKNYPGIEMG